MADFIGEINLIDATATGSGTATLVNGAIVGIPDGATSGAVTLAVRPERLVLHGLGDSISEGRNAVRAVVKRRTYYGDVFFYEVDAGLGGLIEVKEENRPDVAMYEVGDEVQVTWRPEASNLVSAE